MDRLVQTFLRPDAGKCLHYYFYFIDAELGLIYVRVPTWAPFRLQVYCNGHSWLARKLTAEGIGFTTGTMPSCALTIGSAPRNWPMVFRLWNCTAFSTGTRRYAARCWTPSSSPITGA